MGLRGVKPRRKEVIWSPQLAYAVGLIATDGCLSNDGRHFSLVSKDLEQIQNLKKCLELRVKTSTHYAGVRFENRRYHRIQWGDVVLYQFLLNVGITPHKSLTLGSINVPDQYFFHFLRGAFDGDGSFYSYFDARWKSSFMFYLNFTSASPNYIGWLQETLARLAHVSGHISKNHKEGTVGIQTLRYAKKETRTVLNLMYADAQGMYLKRKRLKIVKALRIVEESLVKH